MPDMETLLPIDKVNLLRKKRRMVKTSFKVNVNDIKKLWIFLNDTERMRRHVGMPVQTPKFIPRPKGGSITKISLKKMMMNIEYYDLPPYWDGRVFKSEEIHFKGPFKYLSNQITLKEENGQVRIFVTMSYYANFFMRIVLFYMMLKPTLLKMRKYVLSHTNFINNLSPNKFFFESDLASFKMNENIFNKIIRKMKDYPEKDIVSQVATYVATVGEENLFRIRPFELAAFYKLDKIKVLEFFLYANNKGVFEMSWDLLCPNCEGRRDHVYRLSEVDTKAHCDVCNIAYDVDYASNIELSFRPHPAVRKITLARFCYGGPVNTPQILVQSMLDPASIQKPIVKEMEINLEEGYYYLRVEKLESKLALTVEEGGKKELVVDLIEPDLNRSIIVDKQFKLTLRNTENVWHRAFIVHKNKSKFIATADMVISLSAFRNLYGTDPLAPGVNLGVSSVALIFTDVGGSTQLYQDIGDSKAFSFIKNHFDIINEIIEKHEGALVKTIGDATMICFYDVKKALNCCIEIREKVSEYFADKGLTIKIGLNEGPCIAMNLNDKLDYFGSTVNITARLEQNSDKNKISFLKDILTTQELQKTVSHYSVSSKKAYFKGVGERTILSI